MPEELGAIIRRLREERNMSQVGLAWATNIKASTINNYESGHRKPDIEALTSIAEALDVSLDEFRVSRRQPNAELSDDDIARQVRWEVWSRMTEKEQREWINLVRRMKNSVKIFHRSE